MNIQEEIDKLSAQLKESEQKEIEHHDTCILLRRKIGKLRTVLKDAQAAIGEETPVEETKPSADDNN